MNSKLFFFEKIWTVILILCMTGLANACKQKGSDQKINQGRIDSIGKDIPFDAKGRLSYEYQITSRLASRMHLDSLELGYDSLQIRVWYGYAFKDSGQAVVLKNRDNKWIADLLVFSYLRNDSNTNVIDSVITKVIQRKPKSGWDYFLKKLFELQIMTLPDMDNIKGHDALIADGDAFAVEISTVGNYRFYSYTEPFLFMGKLSEAKNMEKILLLIESEFDFKRLREPKRIDSKNLPLNPKKIILEPIKDKNKK